MLRGIYYEIFHNQGQHHLLEYPLFVFYLNYRYKEFLQLNQNQNKSNQNPVSFLKSIGEWENFIGRVNEYISSKDKKFWLTDEVNIEKIYNDEKDF